MATPPLPQSPSIDNPPLTPQPKQQQRHPGSIFQLSPPADHGEASYCGASRLSGRVAIITGADSGIGRAVAIAFAKEGADIILSYLPEEAEDAIGTSTEIEKAGQKAILRPGDIGSIEYVESLVAAAFDEFNRLDIVVNNAAYQMSRKEIADISPEEFEHTFRTNVFGLFYLTRASLPRLKPGAVVINTTLIQAYEPSEELVPYAATKAALAVGVENVCLSRPRYDRGVPGRIGWTHGRSSSAEVSVRTRPRFAGRSSRGCGAGA